MSEKPFVPLATLRAINRPELPSDLREFYLHHEGVGLESDLAVRLARLDEVRRVSWTDVANGVIGPVPVGWEQFVALLIGRDGYFDDVVYILNAPSCPPGSIMLIGNMASGPGGDGTGDVEPTLVLARTYPEWLTHLQRWAWEEPSIEGIGDLPERERQELCRYYLALNPRMNVGTG